MAYDVTRTLVAARRGDQEQIEVLFQSVHDELYRLAVRCMNKERLGHTLQPTALVNEAYLRLIRHADVDWQDRNHFFAIASRCIRRILAEHARKRRTQKRGGNIPRVTLCEDDVSVAGECNVDLLDLDEALAELEGRNQRQARVVELRFFGGLSVAEAAENLGTSARTIKAEWRFARAWLYSRLRGSTAS